MTILACGRLEGPAAALDMFIDFQVAHPGFSVLDVDVVAGVLADATARLGAPSLTDHHTVLYIRQGLGTIEKLATKGYIAKEDKVKPEDVKRMFRWYKSLKK